ncbi:hypothetical protein RUE5091_00969 [Ruegeria denitrificans]|uniref:VWFA domain-containing protein n=1 Tax=Ruegeria denitrificans TaxID=1715692 RepID=A0A0P1IPD1_9RHOB|nr:DUF1194 domain-containing protein [Ruegeria denitrificans]CUJ90029.1 hypothetical protein RUE5091_00969 [Ruegeria denitrificans]
MIRLLSIILTLASGSAAAECRQALALGLDVSGSVDSREYRLQLDGLAAALQRPEVVQIILSDTSAPMRLAIFEWSEPGHQRLLLDWTAIRSVSDLRKIAALLNRTKRSAAPRGTAVGSAMLFGADLLSDHTECWKRTLDLSGDGKHNLGTHPREAKTALLPTAITINGLVIGADDPSHGDKRYVQVGELSAYYNAWVILGPDAFVEVALGFDAYEDAMTRKLIRELEGLILSDAGPFVLP